jgi:CelD/BcsL family acetyltransferase involved in cellulose biosynthesis
MRGIAVRGAEPASDAAWDRAFAASPHATFFQGRAWATAWERASGGRLRAAARRVVFSDGAAAVLPFAAAPLARGLRAIHVLPAGTFGGWLSEAPLARAHAEALAAWITRRLGDCDFRLSPFTPHADALAATGPTDLTHVLALAPGTAALERGFSKGHRAAVRQAARAGVAVDPARDAADWDAYRALVERSRERWGERAAAPHPPGLLAELARCGEPGVRLWLARAGGRPVAGALCLYGPCHVAYWHGAADEDAFPLRPAHALLAAALSDAAARGFAWFDFGPSGGLGGVARFKRGFGAAPVAVRRAVRHTLATRAAARARAWLGL